MIQNQLGATVPGTAAKRQMPVVINLRGPQGQAGKSGTAGATGLDGADGSGSENISSIIAAGAVIGAPRVVMVVAGQGQLFDPSVESDSDRAIGVSSNAAVAGDPITVIFAGLLVSADSFIADAIYYAGPAGTLLTSPPSTGAIIKIGQAKDANNLMVDISIPIIGLG